MLLTRLTVLCFFCKHLTPIGGFLFILVKIRIDGCIEVKCQNHISLSLAVLLGHTYLLIHMISYQTNSNDTKETYCYLNPLILLCDLCFSVNNTSFPFPQQLSQHPKALKVKRDDGASESFKDKGTCNQLR